MTYAPAKFEVATSNSLCGDAFTSKYIIFDLAMTLVSRSHKMLPSNPPHHVPMHLQSLKLLHPTVKEEMHLQENTFFDLDLWVNFKRNVAQYPLHHVIYAPVKFEGAKSNGLGGDTFEENTLFDI